MNNTEKNIIMTRGGKKDKIASNEDVILSNIKHLSERYALITKHTPKTKVNEILTKLTANFELLALNNYEFPNAPKGAFDELYDRFTSSCKNMMKEHCIH